MNNEPTPRCDEASLHANEIEELKQKAAQADELYNHMHDYADQRDALKSALKVAAVALDYVDDHNTPDRHGDIVWIGDLAFGKVKEAIANPSSNKL